MAHVLLSADHCYPSQHRARAAGAALKTLRRYSEQFPVAKPSYLLLSGRQARRQGRQARAKRLITKAMQTAQKLNMSLHRAMAALELADTTNPSADTARTALQAQQQLQQRDAWGCLALVGRHVPR